MALLQLLFLLSIALTSHGLEHNPPNKIHLLMPRSGIAGDNTAGLNCLSWRLAVETNNIIDWYSIPKDCVNYIGNYMIGDQYRADSKLVVDQALTYLKSLNISEDGNDAWVFDIDETTLSNLPYYADHNFGAEPYNATAFEEWVLEAIAPALPESLVLYNELVELGVKIVFLTGRTESDRNATAINLKNVGYTTYDKLILKDSSYSGKTAVVYKSAERAKLERNGYRIIGNMGDQWSDLLGTNTGIRTFKLPDPMYYIA